MMRIMIDADGCPVVDIAVRLCKASGTECLLLCDTAHDIKRDGATTLVFDKGADSVDYALANRVIPGDLVITQDYGLASLCLARGARVLHQDGWEYTQDNTTRCSLSAMKQGETVPKRVGSKVPKNANGSRTRPLKQR